jgi:hypothetical protein
MITGYPYSPCIRYTFVADSNRLFARLIERIKVVPDTMSGEVTIFKFGLTLMSSRRRFGDVASR